MARKKKEECEEGVPGWMVSYGDMMSLLLTFFVLIVSFSSMQESKFQSAMASIQKALGALPKNSGVNAKMTMFNDQQQKDMDEMINEVQEMKEKIKGLKVEAIGGLTLGADPITSSVVALSDIPGFIVRKKAKEHGTGQKIEGLIDKGWHVVIVEDVATTGGSALQAIEAVEAIGAKVVKVISVVDREEGGADALKNYNFDPILTKSELLA